MKKDLKSARSWGLILPSEWTETLGIIEKVKIIAPRYYYILHDKDYDIETGELKKAHYHVLFTFSSARRLPTVFNYFSEFSDKLKLNSFERINNIIGAKRYLVHIDNPEKHQYKHDQVETNDLQFKDVFIQKRSKDEVIDMITDSSQDTESDAEKAYLERFRPVFQTMSNSYQIGMYRLALKKDFRETFGRTK